MKTYFIHLDMCGKDETTITVECDNIKQEGIYSVILDDKIKLTFEFPVKEIEAED